MTQTQSTRSFEWIRLYCVNDAKGFVLLCFARGSMLSCSIFFSTALIQFASIQAGCDPDAEEACTKRIFGFKPSSYLTNIVAIATIILAFLLPIVGSIVDHMDLRKKVGIAATIVLVLIQAVQIGFSKSTWLVMSILQVFAAVFLQIQLLISTSYLPVISREISEAQMGTVSAISNSAFFLSTLLFLIALNVLVILFNLNAGETVRLSQALNCVLIIPLFAMGWCYMSEVPPRKKLKPGESVLTAGFVDLWKSLQAMHLKYSGGFRWILYANLFADPAMSAFLSISLVYMVEVLKATTNQVGFIYIVSLLSILPGTMLGSLVAEKINPKVSTVMTLSIFSSSIVGAVFVLDRSSRLILIYPFAVVWGVSIGWFYTMQTLLFSKAVPKSEEASFAGLWGYSRGVLGWCPPLIFTLMNEAGIHIRWSFLSIVVFALFGICFLFCCDPWDEIINTVSKEREKANECITAEETECTDVDDFEKEGL